MKFSIQNKILISFMLVIFLALLALVLTSYQLLDSNNVNALNEEFERVRSFTDSTLKQYFLLNNLEVNQTSLRLEANKLTLQLSANTNGTVQVYNEEGNPFPPLKQEMELKPNEDLKMALSGKSSYTIHYQDAKTLVSFSNPIQSGTKTLGAVRFVKDYTTLFKYTERFKTVLILFTAIIFFVIFVLSFLLARHLSKPLRELTQVAKSVAEGNFDLVVTPKTQDEIGELASGIAVMLDRIRKQIRTIEEDRNLLRETQQKSKVFFDNATHELKTPITIIQGYAQLIQDNGLGDKVLFEKGIGYINKEIYHLNHMVIDMLELSKTASDQLNFVFEGVDYSRMLLLVCDEMRLRARERNMRIQTSVKEILMVYGDEKRLRQVIFNLLDNAIKYGREHTEIKVEVYVHLDMVMTRITDQGVGMEAEHLEKIFDPFYRISRKGARSKGSSGLGLSIVKNIVEKHQGTIKAYSETGEGSSFVIGLPPLYSIE